MRKILFLIVLLFITSQVGWGQLDAGRTAKTKIADALAQLPAAKEQVFNQAMKDMASTGEAGISELIKMRESLQGESRIPLDYALQGLTVYATQPQQGALKQQLQKLYGEALKKDIPATSREFYLAQLKRVGDASTVEMVKGYLSDAQLSDDVLAVLIAVGGESATNVVKAAYPSASKELRKGLVHALGELKATAGEELIISHLLQNPEQADVCYAALAKCGTLRSLKVLETAAGSNASAQKAFVDLLFRLAVQESATVVKAAEKLKKNAEKTKNTPLEIAALGILLQANPSQAEPLILTALSHRDRTYRMAALAYADGNNSATLVSGIVGKLKKVPATSRPDILNWLGTNQVKSAVGDVIPSLKDKNAGVRASAIRTLSQLGGEQAILALVQQLKVADQAETVLVEQALRSTPGDIAAPLMQEFEKLPLEGKKVTLALLAARKSDKYTKEVLALVDSKDPVLAKAAVVALKDLSAPAYLPALFDLLKRVKTDDVVDVQQAIVQALNRLPEGERFKTVKQQMNKEQPEVQERYYYVLAATNTPEALRELHDGFFKGKGNGQKEAFQALLTWKGLEVTEIFNAICGNPAYKDYFAPAYNAYVQKVASSSLNGERKLIHYRNALDVAQTAPQKELVLKQIQKSGTFSGMMVAGKYLEDKDLQQTVCWVVSQIALADKTFYGTEITRMLKRIVEVMKGEDSDYQKKAIQKWLAEMPQGEGFVPLFNGKDLAGWKGLVGNPVSRAKMKPADLAKAQEKADARMKESWSAVDGQLVFNGHGDNICTDKQYGDFELYVDWQLSPESKEADAGIYLRGAPQVQIWDNARVNVGAQVGSGGLYNNQRNASKPLKVADNKLGEWNTFRIRMIGERVSVWLNGEKVVDNVILENYWDRSQPIAMLEQIELQAHGSRVAYRDLYIRELEQVKPFALSAEEKKEGFRVLFDGVSMHNWVGNTRDYTAENGNITLDPRNGGGGNLYTKDQFGDFVFRFEFMLTPGANNGLGIRTPMTGDAAYEGMELQILDNDSPIYSTLEKYQYHGSVYGIMAAKRSGLKPMGEWNYQEVIAKGNRIKVILNGEVILDGDLKEATKNGTLDGREHPGLSKKEGHIGFLGHGSPVKFRNIRVKELKSGK